MYSAKNELNIEAIQLVETLSSMLHTFSWIWGGFTMDIYEQRIIREHDDVDCLTLGLHARIPELRVRFENDGWQAMVVESGDLRLTRQGVKIQLGHVDVNDKVRWTHNGHKGSIWFPSGWLKPEPKIFCGFAVHAVEPEFQFVMLEHPELLNPSWTLRSKDILAQEFWRTWIRAKGILPESLFAQVSDTCTEHV